MNLPFELYKDKPHDRYWPLPLSELDPRLRITAALCFSVVVALTSRWQPLAVATAAMLMLLASSGQPLVDSLKRLLPVNVFVLLMFALVPWKSTGESIFRIGSLYYTWQGFLFVCYVAVKANTIVGAVVALLGGLDTITMGHALWHLRVPEKLVHILLFTVRYFDVLHKEYRRLRAAMKVRCFKPRANWHTYQTFGNLLGMLLVRSLERSERILAAMKCRGFRGKFYILEHFHYRMCDVVFAAMFVVLVVGIVLVQLR